jgi:hypothetical protein
MVNQNKSKMIIFFILLLITILSIINKLFLKKHSFEFKLIFSIVTIILYIIICSALFVYLWNSSTGGQPTEPTTKKINFNNVNKKNWTVVVDFKYSNKEILNNSSIDVAYNGIDTIHLGIGEPEFIKTPIPYLDTIKFPESFNIKIIDPKGNIIKTYKKTDFLKNLENPKFTNRNDEECRATNWTLKIK